MRASPPDSVFACTNETAARVARRRGSGRGFTLLELMIVVSLIAVVSAAAGPGFIRLLRIEKVRSEAELVAALVEVARARALATSKPVKIDITAGGKQLVASEADDTHPLGQIGVAGSSWAGVPLRSLDLNEVVVDGASLGTPLIFQPYRGASATGKWTIKSAIAGDTSEYSVAVYRVTGLIKFYQVSQ